MERSWGLAGKTSTVKPARFSCAGKSASFTADQKAKTLLTFPLTSAQLGSGDLVELAIDVDRTFKPGGTDPRELGIRVFHVYIEPK